MADLGVGAGEGAAPVPRRWVELAARPEPSQVANLAADLARRTRDWDAVEDAVTAQALLPAWRRLLEELPDERVPAAVRARVEEAWRGRVAWSETATHALTRVVDAFEAEGIPTLALKGPALAVLLHDDPAARPYGDLDVLVDPRHRDAASRVLARLGYDPDARRPAGPESALRLRSSVSWPGPHGIELDLHWGFDEGGLRLDLPFARLHANATTVRVGDRSVRTLGDAELVVYLAVHGAKHLWQRRLWLADLARLLHVRPAIDWSEVLRLARRTGTGRILASALLLAERLAGARPPDDVLAWARAQRAAVRLADVHAARLAQDLTGHLPSEEGASVGPWRWIALDLAQMERPRDKARGLLAWFLEVSDPGWDAGKDARPPRWGRLARVVRYLGRDATRLVTGGSRGDA